MARKKWTAQTDITPALLKFREKRKWQLALRRYVLEKNPSLYYAPYFGLDIENMRLWFEIQFTNVITWSDFGKLWQFDHIVPVTYFDFSNEHELKMCWNFTNLRVENLQHNKDRGNRLDVLGAKSYFEDLYNSTKYEICQKLLEKIHSLELSELISTENQKKFLTKNSNYINKIKNYSSSEFQQLNNGRSLDEIEMEIAILKKFG